MQLKLQDICAELNPYELYGYVYQQTKWHFSLRPVCVVHDADTLAGWDAQFSGRGDRSGFVTSTTDEQDSTLRSKDSQSFLCFIDGHPLLCIKIFKKKYLDEIFKIPVDELTEEDYGIQCLFPPGAIVLIDKMIFALQSFFEYVWSFRSVNRIFYKGYPGDFMGKIIKLNGFERYMKNTILSDILALTRYQSLQLKPV